MSRASEGPRTVAEVASDAALTIFLALRRYLPEDPERAAWCRDSIFKAIARTLERDRDASRALADAARAQGRREGVEEAARLVDHWHISKGGFCEIAHRIRSLLPSPAADTWAPPKHPCACGHAHVAGTDGEDGGCKVCDCTTWRAPPSAAGDAEGDAK